MWYGKTINSGGRASFAPSPGYGDGGRGGTTAPPAPPPPAFPRGMPKGFRYPRKAVHNARKFGALGRLARASAGRGFGGIAYWAYHADPNSTVGFSRALDAYLTNFFDFKPVWGTGRVPAVPAGWKFPFPLSCQYECPTPDNRGTLWGAGISQGYNANCPIPNYLKCTPGNPPTYIFADPETFDWSPILTKRVNRIHFGRPLEIGPGTYRMQVDYAYSWDNPRGAPWLLQEPPVFFPGKIELPLPMGDTLAPPDPVYDPLTPARVKPDPVTKVAGRLGNRPRGMPMYVQPALEYHVDPGGNVRGPVDGGHVLVPPPDGVPPKDKKKFPMNAPLAKAYGGLTEMGDMVDAMAQALPGQPCRGLPLHKKILCVMAHAPDYGDPKIGADAFWNLVTGELKDRAFGAYGKALAKSVASNYRKGYYPNVLHGLQSGGRFRQAPSVGHY